MHSRYTVAKDCCAINRLQSNTAINQRRLKCLHSGIVVDNMMQTNTKLQRKSQTTSLFRFRHRRFLFDNHRSLRHD